MRMLLVPRVPFVPIGLEAVLSHGTRLGTVPWDTCWRSFDAPFNASLNGRFRQSGALGYLSNGKSLFTQGI